MRKRDHQNTAEHYMWEFWSLASTNDNALVSGKLKRAEGEEDRAWGGTPLHKLNRHVPSHGVRFLRRFGLKTGIHFAHFRLESGLVFEGTTGVYERIYRFNSK